MTDQLLLEKIQKIYETVGGKSAAAVIIEKLGAESFTGDILNPSYVYKIGNRNVLEEDLKIWMQESNPDIEQSYSMLEGVLMQPTKENFLLLFGETLGTTTAFLVPEGYSPVYIAKLHPDTVKEFEKFESQGLIEIITNKSDVRLNSLRPDQPIFSDKKRELGTGYLCAIQLNYFR